jgi:D-alanyl-lipoteichoic acid acyltransferase DltB (MBOAT superfamily)
MIFNSIDFALFLPIIFVLYWFVAKDKLAWQNILLLGASLFFYAWWDPRFLFLLSFSIFLGYVTGIRIESAKEIKWKKFWFWLSIVLNVGFLAIFKYYNFFVDSFATMLNGFGLNVDADSWTLNLILPVGISFYTFHVLSYVIDIYKGEIKSEKNLVDFSLFVSYFPLLVAGPIERATHLLPQIQKERSFDYNKAVDGLRQILWGLFKKVVVADGCAEYANLIFDGSADYSGSTLVMGAIFFTFQIYCDFSGYSDIALGTSRLFGIELLRNFAFPYFSRDIAEFWRRWHISLTTWFRDYIYIPLGGSRGGLKMKIRNTFIIFLVSGFWHGANWTFIVWGGLNALYFLPVMLLDMNRNNLEIVAQGKIFPTVREIIGMVTTFAMAVFGWIFFRAQDLTHAINYIKGIFTDDLFKKPNLPELADLSIAFIIFFMIIEWFGRENKYALENFGMKWFAPLRWLFYSFLIVCVIVLSGKEQEFIYFQF